MIKKTLTYIFSSDPANGAENVSDDGSEFFVTFYDPITVPDSARYCTIGVQAANIWYVTPNISAALDNNIFKFNDDTGVDRTITIPDGLYDLDQLSTTIGILIDNIPTPTPSADLFLFSGDDSTQRVLITFKSDNVEIDWNTSTLRKILGFTTSSPTTAPKDQTIAGDEIARFNQVNSYLIQTDLVHSGIPVNTTELGIIANVFIDTTPGTLINYTPFNIPVANAQELIGARRSRAKFTLTDQTGRRVDTNGEVYSFTLIITYWVAD